MALFLRRTARTRLASSSSARYLSAAEPDDQRGNERQLKSTTCRAMHFCFHLGRCRPKRGKCRRAGKDAGSVSLGCGQNTRTSVGVGREHNDGRGRHGGGKTCVARVSRRKSLMGESASRGGASNKIKKGGVRGSGTSRFYIIYDMYSVISNTNKVYKAAIFDNYWSSSNIVVHACNHRRVFFFCVSFAFVQSTSCLVEWALYTA